MDMEVRELMEHREKILPERRFITVMAFSEPSPSQRMAGLAVP